MISASDQKSDQKSIALNRPGAFTQFLDTLTEPHSSASDATQRTRARLIISLVLANAVLTGLLVLILPLITTGRITAFNIVVVIVEFAIYAISRTRYVTLSARLLLTILIIFIFRSAIESGGNLGANTLSFLILPFLMSSMWFSVSSFIRTVTFTLISVAFLPAIQQLLAPEVTPLPNLLLPVILLIMATAFVAIFNVYRDRVERLRSQELSAALESVRVANTTLAESNQQLDRANKLTRETIRLKSEFMSTMSHELRTPLNAIHGFCGIMLEGMGGEIDEDAKHMLSRIDANSNRLLGLINNVLDIAKIESGRMEIVSTPIVVADMVSRWKQQTGVLAEQKRLHFDSKLDPSMPPVILGDQERLTQIVINLLSNAFKFTTEGTVQLEIKRLDSNWQIVVTDSGIGIPPHAINYIFEEFRQVDGSSTRMYGGSGLGLSIVRSICQMMNGTVRVSSDLGKGSAFTVTLPLTVGSEQKTKPLVVSVTAA